MEDPKHVKGNKAVVDLEANPTAKQLISRCCDFFREVQNLTPGKALEENLNANYGPGTPIFEDLKKYVLQGFEEGWVANEEITGPEYRRSRICNPSAETLYFSITTVYMDSQSNEEILGQYHKHVYGEINMCIPVSPGAKIMGFNGWRGNGWTSPAPGSHHYPQVKNGKLLTLFFLPSGRISYDARPDEPQPLAV